MPKCAIDECETVARRRGWCAKHYQQWRRNHALPCKAGCDRPAEKRGLCNVCYNKDLTKKRPVCTFPGCNKPQTAKGLCQSCYMRKRTTGSADRTYDGKTSHPLYAGWNSMKQRCTNPNTVSYKYYGAVGIVVCDRWLEFWNFVEDMGERPSPDHSVERLDNKIGYQPGNCCWALPPQQARNKRNIRLDVETVYQIKARYGRGEKCTDIAKSLDVHYQTVNSVINGQSWKDIKPRIFD